MKQWSYDPLSGTVIFTTTHFGAYAVSFTEKTFSDIDKLDWAQKKIEILASKGIVNGISDREFSPYQAITRADFVVLLLRTLELQGESGIPFADVPSDAYYSESLRMARELGIAAGSGDNRFQPQDPITREDMMVLTDRALKAANKQPAADTSKAVLSDFDDAAYISGYAMDSVAVLANAGLVHGFDHAIHPKEMASRAQAAVFLYNLYHLG